MDRITLARLRPWLFGLVLPCAGLAALWYVLRDLDWAAFQVQVRELDGRWLVLAAGFDIASYVAQGLRWRQLLAGSTLWQTTRAIYAGLFLNELLPLRPGEAARAWIAARDLGAGLPMVVASMVTERLLDGFWLAAALVAVLAAAPLPAALARTAWVAAAVIGVLILAAWLLGRTRLPGLSRVSLGMTNGSALLASGLFLAGQGLAYWAVTQAGHLSLGLGPAFVVMVVVRLGTMVPGAPANLGTHQLSAMLGLSLYGVPSSQAAGLSLVLFAVLTAPLFVLGFAACLSAGLTWRNAWPAPAVPAAAGTP